MFEEDEEFLLQLKNKKMKTNPFENLPKTSIEKALQLLEEYSEELSPNIKDS